MIAFLYGGVLGVLGASILEAEFLKQASGLTYGDPHGPDAVA
ncbi:MAG TPA: hypothetical protein VIJ13_09495 [Actinomycetota bacterium]